MHDNNSSLKAQIDMHPPKSHVKSNVIPMLDQLHPSCHPYIMGVTDVKVGGHCGYRAIVALLGMDEES